MTLDRVLKVLRDAKPKLAPRGTVLQLVCLPDTDPYGSDALVVYVQIRGGAALKPEQRFRIERDLRTKIGKVSSYPVFFRWFTDAEANLEDLVGA